VKTAYTRGNRRSLGKHAVRPEEEKERLQREGFAEKGGFKSGMKERVGDEKLIIISVAVTAIATTVLLPVYIDYTHTHTHKQNNRVVPEIHSPADKHTDGDRQTRSSQYFAVTVDIRNSARSQEHESKCQTDDT